MSIPEPETTHSWFKGGGDAMEQRQEVVRRMAFYAASLAFAAFVPALVRALSQFLLPATRVPRRVGQGVPGRHAAPGEL
jgi:hypothetical protein